MAYDPALPYDNGYLADAPAELRELFRAIKEDRIVNAGLLSGYSVGNNSGSVPLNNGTLNVDLNADQLDGHDSEYFAAATHTHGNATQNAAGLMSVSDKTKLDNIATGAEVNQNAFSNVTVGANTLQADDKTDTLTLVAGSGISLTGNTINDVVTIAGVNATTSAAGLMSAADKTKLDAIPTTYLPLSGGTLTGNLTLSASAPIIATDTNTKYLRLANLDYNGGASLYMYGAGHTSNPGQFSLNAYDGTTRKTLRGKPDGTLTWGDTDVIYTHPTTDGNKHIPSGGSANKFLKYSASGTAVWGDAMTLDTDQTATASKTLSGKSKYWSVTYGDYRIAFGIGSGGTNRGIWDDSLNKWIVYADASKCYFNGYELNKSVPANAVFTDTHSATHLYVGASRATAHEAASNGTMYLNLYDDTTLRHNIKMAGSGAVTVSSASNGNITINAPVSAPLPTTSSGVGQVWAASDIGKEFTLPSGGTWFYVINCFNPNSTSNGSKVGIASGGTTVTAKSTTDTRSHCWAIRIA